jgi:hypothetical protein
MFIDTLGDSLEAEDNTLALVEDAHTPDFTAHNFADDITDEISGGNYAREAVTSTEITLATGTLTYDAADTVYDNGGSDDVTIADAMAAILIRNTGSDATSELHGLWDFVSAASCTNSTFTVQWNASGLITLDYTP